MKTSRTTSSYLYSSSHYQNFWENFACGLEDNSKQTKKSTKTHAKVVHGENGRCEICYEITKKKQEVLDLEEKVVVKRNGPLEKKMVGNDEIEGEKMDVTEENMVLGMEKDKANEEKRNKMDEIMVESGEVGEGKIVIIDDGVDMETLLGNSDVGEGGAGNGDGKGVMLDLMEVQKEDMFSIEINGEGDPFPGWNQWKFEAEQKWYCSYPLWENENSALNFWDVEPQANDWVVSLWQL